MEGSDQYSHFHQPRAYLEYGGNRQVKVFVQSSTIQQKSDMNNLAAQSGNQTSVADDWVDLDQFGPACPNRQLHSGDLRSARTKRSLEYLR